MKIKYVQDTDPLYIELREAKVAATNDVTIEHATERVC